MNNEEILQYATSTNSLTYKFISELVEYCGYGSNGMINYVVDILQILKQRIENDEEIILENTYEGLTDETFYELIEDNFPSVILNRL